MLGVYPIGPSRGAPPAVPWRVGFAFGSTGSVVSPGGQPWDLWMAGWPDDPVTTVQDTPEGNSVEGGWREPVSPGDAANGQDRDLTLGVPLRGMTWTRNSTGGVFSVRGPPSGFASRRVAINYAFGDTISRAGRIRGFSTTDDFLASTALFDHEYPSVGAYRWRAIDQVEYDEAGYLATGITQRLEFDVQSNHPRIQFNFGGYGAAITASTTVAYIYVEDVTP